jgi:16S rRNA (guanine527-N7)-methyltransferase
MRTNDVGGGALRRPRVPAAGTGDDRPRAPLPSRVEDLPPPPDGLAEALGAVVAEPAQRAPIILHARFLLAWNAAINLTAITDPVALARLHVADSLAAVDLVAAGPHADLLDIGSGGGFPGLPLALALPATRVVLVEATAKKARFLAALVGALGLADRIAVRPERAEALAAPGGPRVDVVTARAVGALADLVELALPLLRPGGRLVAWKRGDIATELSAAARAAAALGGAPPVVVPAGRPGPSGHVLVIVERRGDPPPGYPRDPALRRHRPW